MAGIPPTIDLACCVEGTNTTRISFPDVIFAASFVSLSLLLLLPWLRDAFWVLRQAVKRKEIANTDNFSLIAVEG